jgi:C_GCAxxG_C_C family probable redox protein
LSDNFKLPPEELLNMTAGFATGMGCMETTCGALVGANMITGIQTKGNGTIKKSRELFKEFEEACGATICKDLKGRDTGKVICSCDDCVRNAVIAAVDILG